MKQHNNDSLYRMHWYIAIIALVFGFGIVHLEGEYISGRECTWIGDDLRDARGFVDSCILVPQANCVRTEQWMCIVWDLKDNGEYCWPCSSGECSCSYHDTINVNYREGLNFHNEMEGCNWGTVKPGGECYCLYDEADDPEAVGTDVWYVCHSH